MCNSNITTIAFGTTARILYVIKRTKRKTIVQGNVFNMKIS